MNRVINKPVTGKNTTEESAVNGWVRRRGFFYGSVVTVDYGVDALLPPTGLIVKQQQKIN